MIDGYINTATLNEKFPSLLSKVCFGQTIDQFEGYIMVIIIDGQKIALSKWRSDVPRLFKRADSLITEAKKFGFTSIRFAEDDEINEAMKLITFENLFEHGFNTVNIESVTHYKLVYGSDLFGIELFDNDNSLGLIAINDAFRIFSNRKDLGFLNDFLDLLQSISDKNDWLDMRRKLSINHSLDFIKNGKLI